MIPATLPPETMARVFELRADGHPWKVVAYRIGTHNMYDLCRYAKQAERQGMAAWFWWGNEIQ